MKNKLAQLKINNFKKLSPEDIKRIKVWIKKDLPRQFKLVQKLSCGKNISFTIR
jgi:hypothetical protein